MSESEDRKSGYNAALTKDAHVQGSLAHPHAPGCAMMAGESVGSNDLRRHDLLRCKSWTGADSLSVPLIFCCPRRQEHIHSQIGGCCPTPRLCCWNVLPVQNLCKNWFARRLQKMKMVGTFCHSRQCVTLLACNIAARTVDCLGRSRWLHSYLVCSTPHEQGVWMASLPWYHDWVDSGMIPSPVFPLVLAADHLHHHLWTKHELPLGKRWQRDLPSFLKEVPRLWASTCCFQSHFHRKANNSIIGRGNGV